MIQTDFVLMLTEKLLLNKYKAENKEYKNKRNK